MVTVETQEKLDKLKRLEQAGRDRSKKYLEKIKREGKKQISAVVSQEVYNELNRRRDISIQAGRPLSYGGVIESILQNTKQNIDIVPNVKKNIKPNVKEIINIDVKENIIKTDEIPDCHDKDLTQDERDIILIQVGELYPGRKNSQRRADVLNNAGVPLYNKKKEWIRGQWTKKGAGEAIRRLKNKVGIITHEK